MQYEGEGVRVPGWDTEGTRNLFDDSPGDRGRPAEGGFGFC